MAFPPDDLCITLPDPPSVDDICFPGGFCLSYIWDAIGKIPGGADMPMDFFSQLGPAMAPMAPFFDLLDTILAVYRCVKAVPDAITSLDPTELFQCMPALAELIDKLLKLIPQLSIPKMIKAILHNLATLLRGIASDLTYIQSQLQQIAGMIDRAADLNDVKLEGFLVCAQSEMEDTVFSTADALQGIGRIILLLNIFMGLIGGQEIPCLGDIVRDNIGDGLDVVIDLLTAMAEILDEIADKIIDPDLALTLALGDLKC